MGSVLKILVGHSQDLSEPRVSCPDVQRLHILGPGLQVAGKWGNAWLTAPSIK
jgi:hypothetical protein